MQIFILDLTSSTDFKPYELIEKILIEYSNTNIIIEKDEIKSSEEELTNDIK